jgi:hypothetical protein
MLTLLINIGNKENKKETGFGKATVTDEELRQIRDKTEKGLK